MSFSYADVFDAVAAEVPADAVAIICDDDQILWSEFKERSDCLAASLSERGLEPGAKVALYMRNGADYLIAFTACLKAGLVSANINYRYGPEEVQYLLENSDAEAVIFDAEYIRVLEQVPAASNLKIMVACRGDCAGAISISELYDRTPSPLPHPRSGDDIFLLYTGGTTGLPKGVMWPSGAVWESLAGMRLSPETQQPIMTLDKLRHVVRQDQNRPRFYVAPPFMHGTGLLFSIGVLSLGGTVVCSAEQSFDPHRTLCQIETRRCNGLVIVGDAFARPLLDAANETGAEYRLDHVHYVLSSGMMWSPQVKKGLLEHMPNAIMSDSLGASEASSIAVSLTTRESAVEAASFSPVDTIVIDPETRRPISPGSDQIGVVAKAGPLPLGYYKDPERTARTYIEIDGVRRMISGDHARVAADGTIILLGRGNNSINTAGEKVYPEEVEEALKTHPNVKDALVFGVPHPRFGQAVSALASIDAELTQDELKDWVKQQLAAYKAPRAITFSPSVPRGPNGKPDYAAAKAIFEAEHPSR